MGLTTLCYLEKDDRYLMLHRIKKEVDVNKDKWIGVGGHFEKDETPEECLLRKMPGSKYCVRRSKRVSLSMFQSSFLFFHFSVVFSVCFFFFFFDFFDFFLFFFFFLFFDCFFSVCFCVVVSFSVEAVSVFIRGFFVSLSVSPGLDSLSESYISVLR